MVERARAQVDVVGLVADEGDEGAELLGVAGAAAYGALRLARRARGVDHGARLGRGARKLGLGVVPVLEPAARVELARAGRAAVDRDLAHLRDLSPDRGEELRLVGVGPDEDGVGVVDDVRRLLGREPVVQGHRRRPELARRVGHGDDFWRVHAAPDHAVAGRDSAREQLVREPVHARVELRVAPLEQRAAGSVVDQCGLPGLRARVEREQVRGLRVGQGGVL